MAYGALTTGGDWCAACSSSHWCYRCHDNDLSGRACSLCGRQPKVVYAVPPFNNARNACARCGSVFVTHRCSMVTT